MDLKAFVPAILFKDNEKSGHAKDKEDSKGNCNTSKTEKLKRDKATRAFTLTVLLVLVQIVKKERTVAAPQKNWSWSWRPWT